jgi:hypothetical protein
VSDSFINSKRDKRTIKHSSFVSKIHKTSSSSSTKKRRRPNKKLVATLESLGDALEDIQDEIDAEDVEGMDAEQKRLGRVRHKSLKTRPGALKRKEKVIKEELARFGASLAALAAVKEDGVSTHNEDDGKNKQKGAKKYKKKSAAPADGDDTMETDAKTGENEKKAEGTAEVPRSTNRWAALRTFISSTMEQNPAFLGYS